MRYVLIVVMLATLAGGGWWFFLHKETKPKQTVAVTPSNVVGTVIYTEGTATLTPQGGKTAPVQVTDKVHGLDTLETGAASRMFVLFIDDTQFTLSEKTKLTVDKYIFDPDDSSANSGGYSVLAGAFRYVSGLIAKKENPDVQINTPVGTIGIRGTDVTGGVVNGEYKIQVDDGSVNVKTGGGEQTVNKGQMTGVVGANAKPSFPMYSAQEQQQPLRQMVYLKDNNAVQQGIQRMQPQQQQMRQQYQQYMRQQGGPGGMQRGPGGPGGQQGGMRGGPSQQGMQGGPGGQMQGGPGGMQQGGPGGQRGPGGMQGGPGMQGGQQGGPGGMQGGPGGMQQGGPGGGMQGGPGGMQQGGGPGQMQGGQGGPGGPMQGGMQPGGQPGMQGGPGGQMQPGGMQGGKPGMQPGGGGQPGGAPAGGGGARPAGGGGGARPAGGGGGGAPH